MLLYLGAEWLVKGGAGLGRSLGVRPLVIGVTVVAYGTSAPELVVSSVAALDGMSGLALGNVIGSNLANLGFILGLTALIAPVAVEGSLIRREAPVMLAASLALPLLLMGGGVSRFEGVALLLCAAAFTFMAARTSLRGSGRNGVIEADAEAAGAPPGTGRLRLALIAVCGLVLLVAGGHVFVTGASGLALALGVSQRIVGLTVAAIGTSMPELAASIVAVLRGHPSIAIGNVVGSNVFNVLFVLGGVAVIRPIPASVAPFALDLAALAALSVLGLLVVHRERVIRRREGVLLLACYGAYLFLLSRGA